MSKSLRYSKIDFYIDMTVSQTTQATVSIVLNGGLGNQMFQYAAGKAYAKQYNLNFILNTGAFALDAYYKRTYGLDVFNLSRAAKLIDRSREAGFYIRLLGLRQNKKLPDFCFGPLGAIEPTFAYNDQVLNTSRRRNHGMVGYWQDERYFNRIRSEIVADFEPLCPLSLKNSDLLAYIKSKPNLIAVHLRCNHEQKALAQGEQTEVVPQKDSPNVLQPSYYEQAFRLMSDEIEMPEYLIFSDNPAWVKEHYRGFTNATVLDNDRGADWEDIHLMQQCGHHIIANSSFSWWGAWLGHSEQQIVIAPARKAYTPNIPASWRLLG